MTTIRRLELGSVALHVVAHGPPGFVVIECVGQRLELDERIARELLQALEILFRAPGFDYLRVGSRETL